MEQVIRGVEMGAAVLFFVIALWLGCGMHSEIAKMQEALQHNLRQEWCVEEKAHG